MLNYKILRGDQESVRHRITAYFQRIIGDEFGWGIRGTLRRNIRIRRRKQLNISS